MTGSRQSQRPGIFLNLMPDHLSAVEAMRARGSTCAGKSEMPARLANGAGSSASERPDNGTRFGEELYRLRTAAGLRQIEVAQMARLARGYYSQLENSKRLPPPPSTLRRIALALQLTIGQTKRLEALASAERGYMLQLPDEMPARIARVIRQITQRSHRLSTIAIRRLEDILEEAEAM